MRKAVEIKIYKTIVKPAVGFWSEIWTVTEKDMKTLGTWERKILRRIHGPVVERIWSTKTNLLACRQMIDQYRAGRKRNFVIQL